MSVMNWAGSEMFTIHDPAYNQVSRRLFPENPEASEYFVYTGVSQKNPVQVGSIARHLPRQHKVKTPEEEDENNQGFRRDQSCAISFPSGN